MQKLLVPSHLHLQSYPQIVVAYGAQLELAQGNQEAGLGILGLPPASEPSQSHQRTNIEPYNRLCLECSVFLYLFQEIGTICSFAAGLRKPSGVEMQ